MATLLATEQLSESSRRPARSKCPRRQRGPLSWLLDSTLLFAGLLTSVSVSVLGAVLASGGLRRLVPRGLSA